MSAQPGAAPRFPGVKLDSASTSTPASSPSLWDRVSTWASENKAFVYTIAGVAVVVTGAGVVYYMTDSKKTQEATERRVSKKERRKAKKEREAAEKEGVSKSQTSGNF